MTRRRDFLVNSTAAMISTILPAAPAGAAAPPLETRPIPSSGERLPVIGLGTSGSFEVGDNESARARLRIVLRRFVAAGASVIDTAPTYTSAEDVLGDLVAEAEQRPRLFLATKLSGVVGRDAGLAQFEDSLRRLQTEAVDLLQVHNLNDTATQLELARALKAEGKVRYVGITHYVESAHEALAESMERHRPDFVQINYSPVSRGIERRVLPLAADLGIAVMINRAFEDGRLFTRVAGLPLPDWAGEVGAESWAQLFLKFALSPPAVTVVIPATSKPRNLTDNLAAGRGPMLDERQRNALVAALA
ncbi:MAG TPA: aldo/keto reductase [Gammaproteobacteria bacterium]|nr:aldo/keto reductase [Gammaproteobacteria bacterium]